MSNINNTVSKFLTEILSALGQMNHIQGSVECAYAHKKEPKDKGIRYHQAGLMSMPVSVRQELIDRGWKLVKTIEEKKEDDCGF